MKNPRGTLGTPSALSQPGFVGRLPFTGLALWFFVALALALIGTGVRLRALSRA